MKRQYVLAALTVTVLGFASTSKAELIWLEDFSYGNGALTTVSDGNWLAFSGAGNLPITITDGSVNVVQVDSGVSGEDLRRPLDSTYSTGTLYLSVNVSTTQLTTSTAGTYFLSFYNEASSGGGYAGRIFAAKGSSDDTVKLGLSNAGNTATFSGDLALNSIYTLVLKYDLDTDTGMFGVFPLGTFPTSDAELTISGGAANSINLTSVALRQATSSGGGTQNISSIAVGTTLADVAPVPEPGTIALVGLGIGAVLYGVRRRRA